MLLAALVRAACVEAKGYEFDLFMFRDWAVLAHDHGMGAVLHAPEQDYIGYHYILWLEAALYATVAGPGWQDDYLFLHVLKVPGALADLGVIVLLYNLTRSLFRRHPELTPAMLSERAARLPGVQHDAAAGMALLAACLYAFNPGVIYATSYWGQLDSVPALFMLAALAAVMSRRLGWAWTLLAVGFVLKPQAVILYPVLAIVSVRQGGVRELLRGGLATAAVMAVSYAYFAAIGEIDTVFSIYRGIFTDASTKVSTSAWNIWWPSRIHGNPDPSEAALTLAGVPLSYNLLSQALTMLAGLLVIAYTWRSKSPMYAIVAASFLAFSFFMLPMKIHERYLFPLFALMAPLAVQNRGAFLVYLLLTLTFAANLFGVYQVFFGYFFKQRDVALVCTAVNIGVYVAFTVALLRETLRRREAVRNFAEPPRGQH